MKQSERLELLKEILLTDEKEVTSSLVEKVEKLERTLNEEKQLAAKVSPFVDRKIDSVFQDMPTKISPIITKALKNEIKNSQDAVVEALFPIIGKLIKKYISSEIAQLNERVNTQINEAFSFKNWFKTKKQRKKIVSDALITTDKPQLLQVLVIEKESGILKASHTLNTVETMDEEMIAGMLTAIKSFVEDAFKGGNQSLETIEYEFCTLHIQNFHNYYITAVISGIYNSSIKSKVEDLLYNFAEKELSMEDVQNNEVFTEQLKQFFSGKSI